MRAYVHPGCATAVLYAKFVCVCICRYGAYAETAFGTTMILGYNTNGMAHHDVFDAVALLAEIGYESVAITLDHGALDPWAPDIPQQVARMRQRLERFTLRSVVETGARYLLDPRRKHEPTLLTADRTARDRRIDFLKRAIDIASQLGSDCVSLWSGTPDDQAGPEAAFARLTDALRPVIDSVFPLAEARAAHERLEAGEQFGKIVLPFRHSRNG